MNNNRISEARSMTHIQLNVAEARKKNDSGCSLWNCVKFPFQLIASCFEKIFCCFSFKSSLDKKKISSGHHSSHHKGKKVKSSRDGQSDKLNKAKCDEENKKFQEDKKVREKKQEDEFKAEAENKKNNDEYNAKMKNILENYNNRNNDLKAQEKKILSNSAAYQGKIKKDMDVELERVNNMSFEELEADKRWGASWDAEFNKTDEEKEVDRAKEKVAFEAKQKEYDDRLKELKAGAKRDREQAKKMEQQFQANKAAGVAKSAKAAKTIAESKEKVEKVLFKSTQASNEVYEKWSAGRKDLLKKEQEDHAALMEKVENININDPDALTKIEKEFEAEQEKSDKESKARQAELEAKLAQLQKPLPKKESLPSEEANHEKYLQQIQANKQNTEAECAKIKAELKANNTQRDADRAQLEAESQREQQKILESLHAETKKAKENWSNSRAKQDAEFKEYSKNALKPFQDISARAEEHKVKQAQAFAKVEDKTQFEQFVNNEKKEFESRRAQMIKEIEAESEASRAQMIKEIEAEKKESEFKRAQMVKDIEVQLQSIEDYKAFVKDFIACFFTSHAVRSDSDSLIKVIDDLAAFKKTNPLVFAKNTPLVQLANSIIKGIKEPKAVMGFDDKEPVTETNLRGKYYRLSVNCHPDKCPGEDDLARAVFFCIATANELLKDSFKYKNRWKQKTPKT